VRRATGGRVRGVTPVIRLRSRRFATYGLGTIVADEGSYFDQPSHFEVRGVWSVGRNSYVGIADRIVITEGGRLEIGDEVVVDSGVRFEVRGTLRIESGVYIGRDTVIVAYDLVEIGRGSLIGERVSIHDENHGPPGARLSYSTAPISIGSEVWLGAGVVVTAGSRVGEGATVGANAVVTGEIAAGVTAVGVPARPIRRR
jgi:acetyltransferase-like isoleucine patch superfamily enzyme